MPQKTPSGSLEKTGKNQMDSGAPNPDPAIIPSAENTDAAHITSHSPPAVPGLQYLPMWDIRRQAISTYVATSARHGAVAGGNSSDGGYAAIRQRVDLDHAMLAGVTRELGDLLQAGLRALVSLPLHYDTVASASTRMEYLRQIRDLPD